ncbi:uncharacterized protein LOC131673775 [Phymastichus coffea]|nr:uncharacterized protein LOC131665708 [Phymastichus coffea]XP_058808032.1 uncharacterized protein LOC131673775 [Phymastichus coffea]
MSSAKSLPVFKGDPLEWLRFKNAFETSTATGNYNEEDNVLRIADALKDKAFEAVKSLFMSCKDTKLIMQTLEMRFGNSKLILDKLCDDIRKLPNLNVDESRMIEFATILRNTISAIKGLNGWQGYLQNPEIIDNIIRKLPDSIVTIYAHLDSTNCENKTDLEKLSDFIFEETNKRIKKNLIILKTASAQNKRPHNNDRDNSRNILLIDTNNKTNENDDDQQPQAKKRKTEKSCLLCNRRNHLIKDCRDFAKEKLNVRWKFARSERLCFVCLEKGHSRENCQSKITCARCKRNHHTLLHFTPKDELSKSVEAQKTAQIDNASVIKRLSAPKFKTNIYIKGIAGEKAVLKSNYKTNLHVKIESDLFAVNNLLVVNEIPLSRQVIVKELADFCKQRTDVYVEPFNEIPLMLIGQDNCRLILTREVRTIMKDDLVVSRCLLGWSIHGHFNSSIKTLSINLCNTGVVKRPSKPHNDKELNELVFNYFNLDAIGIIQFKCVDPGIARAIKILDSTSNYVNDSWEVGLLWKSEKRNFPDGKAQALSRLLSLERKLDRDKEYAGLYYKEMERLFECGFAEKVIEESSDNRIYYLPHFGVRNVNKPGRVRLVFDAASKSESVSFNDLLLPGPDYLKSLPGILMRFRQYKIAVKSDIKDMFMKIKIIDSDRDAQRFLWRGSDRTNEPTICRMRVLLFGAKSSPSTALYIKNKNAMTFQSQFPIASQKLIENCYMDDYLDSFESSQEANDIVKQVIKINEKSDFKMHSWSSNCRLALVDIHSSAQSKEIINSLNLDESVEKVLGLKWLNSSDCLTFNFNSKKISPEILQGVQSPTKRQFLGIIMSIYDPLGFLLPFLIQSRFLMQKIWKSKIHWDDLISNDEFIVWKKWLLELKNIESVKINRCYQLRDFQKKDAELHVFCDASSNACAAVCYWRFHIGEERFHVAFVMAKSRAIALSDKSTIPRLELQAALIGVRLAEFVVREHDFFVKKRYFWSDSTTVLSWIRKNPLEFKSFVANRVGEIRKKTNPDEWHWVSSSQNAADDGTRFRPEALQNKSRWLSGPPFLFDSEIDLNNKLDLSITEKTVETEKEFITREEFILLTNHFSPLIDFNRFSTFLRLTLTLAKALEILDIWMKRNINLFETRTERFERAKTLVLIQSQVISFQAEIASLKYSGTVRKNSKITNLSPYVDENGLLRSDSRIQNKINQEFRKDPIILDGDERLSRLIIQHYHEEFFHMHHEAVINEIRQLYFIIGLRRVFRSIVAHCPTCRQLRAKPYQPRMCALPDARLAYRMRPFSHCGLDYFGPIWVKIGRRKEKRWGAIFTCMTVRAIHIELVDNLSADSAIMALRRFSALRGFPVYIYSDNGTCFVGANRELLEAIESIDYAKLFQFTSKNNIVWKFNPPTASNMGGAWERLIRSVKCALAATIRHRHPKEETLRTILAEIEHSVNSRPLTHVSADPHDLEALTPNHFLIGSSSGQLCLPRYTYKNLDLKKEWKKAQMYADEFWNRWLREYLPTLHSRKKWQKDQPQLKINDLVIITDENVPRNCWKKGIVIRVLPGADNRVRVVELRTENGVLTRPSNKLVKYA